MTQASPKLDALRAMREHEAEVQGKALAAQVKAMRERDAEIKKAEAKAKKKPA
jgi:hypothetical protein